MKIKFIGAAQEVTGSAHMLTCGGKNILLDCGLYQGKRMEAFQKNHEFLFKADEVNEVVLSHAHIDHSGNLPALSKRGFTGNIFCTFATRDLCSVMLEDSAHIQELDEEYMQKLYKKGKAHPIRNNGPLYTVEDVRKAMHHFVSMDYHREFFINEYVRGMFYDAGHVLGSAITFLQMKENGKKTTLTFTGDLGREGLPILRDPEQLTETDYLIIESTYGNRTHDPVQSAHKELADVINRTMKRGGKIIVPAFALERTQEILYHIQLLLQEGAIEPIPVFVDSPLAVNITDIFRVHPECYDDEAKKEFIDNRENPFGFGRVKYVTSVADSKDLNRIKKPCIIISAAGMCEAGRIRHHLANSVQDKKNTVLTVGYMAKNTLGRKIVERESQIKIFDHMYHVKSEVVTLHSFSAHADKDGLFDYVKNIKKLKKVFIVHGEFDQQKALSDRIQKELDVEVMIPERGEEVEL